LDTEYWDIMFDLNRSVNPRGFGNQIKLLE